MYSSASKSHLNTAAEHSVFDIVGAWAQSFSGLLFHLKINISGFYGAL